MAEKLTFKEDPAAAEAFGFKEDPSAASAFGAKARDTQGAAEAMRGKAKVARDEEETLYDLSSGPITQSLVPLIHGKFGKPYQNTGELERRQKLSVDDPEYHKRFPIADVQQLDESNAELEKFNSGMRGIMGGAGIGSVLGAAPVFAAGKAAAPAFRLTPQVSAAKMATSDLIKTAISQSTKSLAKHVIGEAGTEATGELAARAGHAAIGAAKAIAPAVGAASPAAVSPISNMVERLRGSAAGNPRAGELMSKVDALMSMPNPTFPAASSTGTVTQSTLGNGS